MTTYRTVFGSFEIPYYNPRPLEPAAIRHLLQDAWEGRRPSLV
jgi:maleylacetate reductase